MKVFKTQVCPECNNPVQIVGLYCENRETDLFAKHLKNENKRLKKISRFNEQNKQNCKYFTGRECKDPFKPIVKGEMEKILCRTMRDNFDKVVYFWEVLTGIKLGKEKAKKYLENWIDGKIYRCTYCTSSTLSLSLKCAQEPTSLLYSWIDCKSNLYDYISTNLKEAFCFEDTSIAKWKKIVKKDGFASLDFNFLPYYKRITNNSGCVERMTMQVIARYKDKEVIKEIELKIESDYWDNIMNMKNWSSNEALLNLAKEQFKGMNLD